MRSSPHTDTERAHEAPSAPAMRTPSSQIARHLPALAVSLVVAGGLVVVALDGGGYALTSRHALAIVLLWLIAVAVALGFWPRQRIPRGAMVVASLLFAFTLWTGLSTLWSPSAEKSFNEFDRVALYAAVFAVALLATSSTNGARAWLRGLGLGIATVGLVALSSRLFPNQFADTSAASLAQLDPTAARRLNYPLDYWNSLATLIALGLPCLLWAATTERRAVIRAFAVLPLPALAAALYLTSSRGGIAVAGLGVIVFLALSRRWRAVGAVAVAGAASVLSVGVLLDREALTTNVLAPEAAAEGRGAAVLIGLACVAAAVGHGLLSSVRLDLGRASRPLGIALGGVAATALTVGLVLLDPVDRVERFKAVPSGGQHATLQAHLASGSGSGRWQLWESAVDQFAEHRLTGEGAGTYEAWWARSGTLDVFVRDAHSLYLETLSELGVIGLVLLASALIAALVIGIRRALSADLDGRVAVAALVAAAVAWLVEAGIDWMWESTIVTVTAVICLALLVGPATSNPDPTPRQRRAKWVVRTLIPVIALGLIVAQGIPFLAGLEIERSQAEVRAGNFDAALDAAVAAERVQPWAASPHTQRALVEELRGRLRPARTAIERALERDTSDWRLWLIDARIETKLKRFEEAESSLRQAIDLNPRTPRFRKILRVLDG